MNKERMNIIWRYILLTIGCLCLFYYLFLSIKYGLFAISFSWSFLCMGIVLSAYGAYEVITKQNIFHKFSKTLRTSLSICIGIALLFFFVVQGYIIYQGSITSNKQGDYAIVLGAQLKGKTITKSLRYRLESAVTFAQTYPQAYLIVSGGQGAGELTSEAHAMTEFLVAHGIDKERILQDDTSRNTQENFANSMKFIPNNTSTITLITNNFHMARANYIGSQQGLSCMSYPSRSDLDLAPVFYFREFFALLKDIAVLH